MLDLGFLPDVERILRFIPDGRQTMLFSATMPGPVISAGAPVHDAADAHPGPRPRGRRPHRRQRRAARLPRARPRQGRDAGPHPAGAGPRPDHGLLPHQAHRAEGVRRAGDPRLRRPAPCTATSARVPASRRCARSATARSTCSSPPTWPPAASTSRASPTSSTTSAPRTRRPTCTGSAVRLAPAPPAPRSPSSTGTTSRAGRSSTRRSGLDFESPAETYSTSDHFYEALDIPRHVSGELPQGVPHGRRPRRRGGRGPRRDRQGAPRQVRVLGLLASSGSSRGSHSGGGKTTGSRGSGRGASSRRLTSTPRPARTRTSGQRTRTRGGAPVDASANGSPNGSGAGHLVRHRLRRVGHQRGCSRSAAPARRPRQGQGRGDRGQQRRHPGQHSRRRLTPPLSASPTPRGQRMTTTVVPRPAHR